MLCASNNSSQTCRVAVESSRNECAAPVVSVIIPNYNHSKYLRQRIDSVLNQTFKDIEVILLDDCSQDDSRAVIESYRGDSRISNIVYNETNSGSTFAQWKRGIGLARGRYVWIAESDDASAPNFLETLVAELELHPDSVLAFSGSHMIDADGKEIPGVDWDRYKNNAERISYYSGLEFVRKKLLWTANLYNASMAIFRRSAVPAFEPRQLKMRYCGDWLFWLNVAQNGDVIEVREKLNYFRQHDKKVSPGASKSGIYFIEGLPIMCRIADVLGLSRMQRGMLAGRTLKRLRKYKAVLNEHGDEIADNLERLYNGAMRSKSRLILWYEIDKHLNFTGLQMNKS